MPRSTRSLAPRPSAPTRPARSGRLHPTEWRSSPPRHRTHPTKEEHTVIIDKAEVIVTSPDRNFVTLRLTTDDGHRRASATRP